MPFFWLLLHRRGYFVCLSHSSVIIRNWWCHESLMFDITDVMALMIKYVVVGVNALIVTAFVKIPKCTHGSWTRLNSFSEPFEAISKALMLLHAVRQPASFLSQFPSPTPYPTCMCSFFPLSLSGETRLFFVCTNACLCVSGVCLKKTVYSHTSL